MAWREGVVQHQITAADPRRLQQRQLPAGIPQPPAAAAAPAAAPRTALIQLLQHLQRFGVPVSAEGRIVQGQLQGAWIQLQAKPLQLQPPRFGGLQQGCGVVPQAHTQLEHSQGPARSKPIQTGRGHEFLGGFGAGTGSAVETLAETLTPEGEAAVGGAARLEAAAGLRPAGARGHPRSRGTTPLLPHADAHA